MAASGCPHESDADRRGRPAPAGVRGVRGRRRVPLRHRLRRLLRPRQPRRCPAHVRAQGPSRGALLRGHVLPALERPRAPRGPHRARAPGARGAAPGAADAAAGEPLDELRRGLPQRPLHARPARPPAARGAGGAGACRAPGDAVQRQPLGRARRPQPAGDPAEPARGSRSGRSTGASSRAAPRRSWTSATSTRSAAGTCSAKALCRATRCRRSSPRWRPRASQAGSARSRYWGESPPRRTRVSPRAGGAEVQLPDDRQRHNAPAVARRGARSRRMWRLRRHELAEHPGGGTRRETGQAPRP